MWQISFRKSKNNNLKWGAKIGWKNKWNVFRNRHLRWMWKGNIF